MLSAEQRVNGHVWKAVSAPASDPCSGGGLVARPGLFKLAGLKSRRFEVVGGFLGGMVTFPASRCFTLCSTAVFTGPGEGYKAEHRETRGHNQKSVPAEFVKTTTMQSTASHWEVNLLAQSLQGVCPPRVHTLGSCMLPSPLGRGVLSGTSWLLLGHAFSSLGAPGSDGLGFYLWKDMCFASSRVNTLLWPHYSQLAALACQGGGKNFLPWQRDQDLNHSVYS